MKSLIKERTITTILLVILLLSVLPIPVYGQGHPVGVGGYISDSLGFVDNASVMIENTNTGEIVYATTDVLGLYGKAITASNGDKLYVTAQKGTKAGYLGFYVNISEVTQWANITIKTPTGGGTIPQQEVNDTIPRIPEPQPPKYPGGYDIELMYDLLKIWSLPSTDNPIKVLVIDSGVTPTTFKSGNTTIDLKKITALYNTAFTDGWDQVGHGTFTNYEIAYLLQSKCPNSIQISYRMFGAKGETTNQIFDEALEAILTIKPDVVSISAGAMGNPSDVYSKVIERCKQQGIIVVTSAGNYGPKPSTIISPGCSASAISVGSFDFHETLAFDDDTVSLWSSRGPVSGVSPKPDIVAPGESLIGPWKGDRSVKSGTSMACPLISAGTALVIANNKPTIDLVKSLYFWDKSVIVQAYEDALKEGSIPKGEENSWGAGIPQFDKVNEIFAGKLRMLILQWILIIIVIISLIVGTSIIIIRRMRRSK